MLLEYSGLHVLMPLSSFRTAAPEVIPAQTYDYDALNSFISKQSTVNDEPEKQVTANDEPEKQVMADDEPEKQVAADAKQTDSEQVPGIEGSEGNEGENLEQASTANDSK
jgi:hypothetical protein